MQRIHRRDTLKIEDPGNKCTKYGRNITAANVAENVYHNEQKLKTLEDGKLEKRTWANIVDTTERKKAEVAVEKSLKDHETEERE